MKTTYHASGSRGFASHGWLEARHTFSFAGYYDPNRVHFGMLRVLNDDIIQPAEGFGTHPHDNMEIVTIPITGALQHRDSMGNGSVITRGEIQVMSAGSGITHSEFNASATEEANTLQIWIFPEKRDIPPRYDQMSYEPGLIRNQFKVLISPDHIPGTLWVNQQTWFSLGDFDAGHSQEIHWNRKDHGIYMFLIDGGVRVGEHHLEARDGLGIWDTESVNVECTKDSRLLLIEVPMR